MLRDYTRGANSLSVSLGFLLFCSSKCTYTRMNDRDRITGIYLSWLDLLLFFFGSHSQMSVLNWGLLIVHKLSQPCGITGEELYRARGSSPRFRAAILKSERCSKGFLQERVHGKSEKCHLPFMNDLHEH